MARGVNKAIIVGTLGQDPEVRYTGKRQCPVANLRRRDQRVLEGPSIPANMQERTEWHQHSHVGPAGRNCAAVPERRVRKPISKAEFRLANGKTSRATIATAPRSSPTRCKCWAVEAAAAARRRIRPEGFVAVEFGTTRDRADG